MLQLINYFFIPALSVLLHEKDKNPMLTPSVRLLAIYCVFTAAIVPCTHVMTSVFYHIFNSYIPVESSKYTLFALISAFFLPKAYRKIREIIQIELVISPKEET